MKKNLTTLLFALVAMMPIGAWAKDAVITGVTITVDGIEYGVGDTAVVTPNTTSLIITVYGERFANVTSANYITYTQGLGDPLTNGWTIDTEKNTATCDFSNKLHFFESNITPFEVTYSNDNRVTRINSGVYVVYDYGLSEEEKAVITGVTITVDGIEYGVGDTAVVTPNTTSLIYTVYGERFANVTKSNCVWYTSGSSTTLSNDWTIDTEKNTATYDFSMYLVWFESTLTPFEVMYSNDYRASWTNSGVYIMYDHGLSEEEKAVITGVTITVDGIEYGVGDTAVVTSNTTSLIYTVYGERFANLTSENYIAYSQYSGNHLTNGWSIDTEKNTAIFDFSMYLVWFESTVMPFEVKYSNDDGANWTNSGVYIVYSEQNDTSLDQLTHDNQANSHKILRDGQVIILRDGKAYNLMGVAL